MRRMEQELMKRRVVVTGLGLVTPLGNTVEATWAGLMAGRSGAGPITKFDASDFPVRFACEVKGFDPLDYVEKKEARKMGAFTRGSRLGRSARRQRLKDHGRERRKHRHLHQQRHRRLLGHRARTLEVSARRADSCLALFHRLGARQHGGGAGLDQKRGEGTELRDINCVRRRESRHR